MPTQWRESLPDVSSWQPQSNNNDTLENALEITCQLAQNRITSRSQAEACFNIFNYDSGFGVEDIVREELANLLPQRYSVEPGVVNDRCGNTAGDCDLILRDRIWSPAIKLGATGTSRRFHFPIEGVYAVAEIKQTLEFGALDAAMKKLVTVSRLERPDNPYGHITENQHIPMFDRPGAILNPLHTSVFATGLPADITFVEMVRRFGAVNAKLTRHDMVKMLCVLDHGTAWYSVAGGAPYNATYMTDRDQTLVLQVNDREPQNAFYRFYVELQSHLTRSVLGLANMSAEYGNRPPHRQVLEYESAVFNQEAQSTASDVDNLATC